MSVNAQRGPTGNRLLDALPHADRDRLLSHLRTVELPFGKVVHEPGGTRREIYFPVHCVLSKLYVTEDGNSAEVAMVGNEGLIGTPLLLGCTGTPVLTVVQVAGTALCGDIRALRGELEQAAELQKLALRHAQALITQMGQNAVCYRHHRVERQLCCWLLLMLDRAPSSHLRVTQQVIGQTLGIRREGVNEAVGQLQRRGIVSLTRGSIDVLDRAGLEGACCECYAVITREYKRLLP